MRILSSPGSAELNIKNSRFIAEAFIVGTQEEARALIKAQKERYADATHVVHAFVIGPSGGILGCSDDGEPSGTAGRPVLDVLKGSGLTNALVTVTRWFGGTLLGTGGLVKAYGDSAKAVLAGTPSEELVAMRDFSVEFAYEVYDRARREMVALGAQVEREDFGTVVLVSGRVREADAEALSERVADVSSGRARVTLAE
jgi:uncharacterized YigZ family protein